MTNRLRLTGRLVVGALAGATLLISTSPANASICQSEDPPSWCDDREPPEPSFPPTGNVDSLGDYDFDALKAHWADLHTVPDPNQAEGWRVDWDHAYHESHAHTTHVVGWAIDPDTTAPIDVQFYANGRHTATARADLSRPDVGKAYPGYGDRHGFSVDVPIGPTPDEYVCVKAINVDSGDDRWLGCSYWWFSP